MSSQAKFVTLTREEDMVNHGPSILVGAHTVGVTEHGPQVEVVPE